MRAKNHIKNKVNILNKENYRFFILLVSLFCLIVLLFLIYLPSIISKAFGTETSIWNPAKNMHFRYYDPDSILLSNGNALVIGYCNVLNSDFHACAEIYNPELDEWVVSNIGAVNADSVSILKLKNGQYFINGLVTSTDLFDEHSVFLYNEISDEWKTVNDPINSKRKKQKTILLPDGTVFVVGGFEYSSDGRDVYLPSTEIFDPNTSLWIESEPMHLGRIYHSAIMLNNNKVLIAGGSVKLADDPVSTSQSELYDFNTNSWERINSMLEPRESHAATLLFNGKVLITGGIYQGDLDTGSRILSSVEIYDPMTGQWSHAGNMNVRRYQHTATLLPDGKVLVAGGWNNDLLTGEQVNLKSAEIFDPITSVWTLVSDQMKYEHFGHTALKLSDGKVLIAAGDAITYNQGNFYYNTAEIFDPGNLNEDTLESKAAELAKLVIGAPYLGDGYTYGGKGYDSFIKKYVESRTIKTGYNYYNNALKRVAFGAGLDCSGLVMWAYNRAFGATEYKIGNPIFYEGADGQYRSNTKPITESELKPGDLMFFNWDQDGDQDHVAMYIGGDDVANAKSQNAGIVLSKKSVLKNENGFTGFRRRIDPIVKMKVKANSPIFLSVTDPEGFHIDQTTFIETDEEYLTEIPGELYYSQTGIDEKGFADDIVYSPKMKQGDYIIKVAPKPDASSDDAYGLEFEVDDSTIKLAENVKISDIPQEGYGVEVSENGITPFLPINLEIKPGSDPAPINLKSKGVLPVAILSSETFDVIHLNPSTIKFGPSKVSPIFNKYSYKDVNNDGNKDLILQFDNQLTGIINDDTDVCLTGTAINQQSIKGCDSIKIVGN